ncbi:reduced folate carrier [Aphelenchoides avenae]|nr:reduced folate carrier [Aphelenchus avenae]
MRIVKWSLWYALATCGEFQVGNYIQALWAEAQSGVENRKVYNGFVEASIPLISACAIMLLQKPRLNWDKWGEPVLTAAAFVDFAALLVLALSHSIGVMYAGYAVFRVLYQMMITIAQFNIVCRIPSNSYGFVLGFNTFVALALQTVLTLVVADEHGLALAIRTQFVVYAAYHAVIGAIFLVALAFRFVRSRTITV